MLLLRANNHASMACFQAPIAREDTLQSGRDRYEAGLAGEAPGRPILSPIMPELTGPCVLELTYNRRNVLEKQTSAKDTFCVEKMKCIGGRSSANEPGSKRNRPLNDLFA
jgi:hypothetical protein